MKTTCTISIALFVSVLAAGQQAELLKDINTGTGSSYISYMTQIGNKVVFKAINSSYTNDEPWVTDGTPEGTFMLREINPSTKYGCSMSNAAAFNNEVYFSADDGTNGSELWKTDGTSEGTVMVKDIAPGSTGSKPGHLVVFKNALYFSAYHPDTGTELWRTSGTEQTTELVANITEEEASTQPGYLYPTANYLYFNSLSSLKLYHSDGTSAGSGLVSDQVKAGQLDAVYFTEYKGDVYFRGTDLTLPGSKGTQLWKVSGSSASRVTEIVDEEEDLDPRYLTAASGVIFFAGIDATHGRELWAYNGTSASIVKDINTSGHGNLSGSFFIAFKDKLVFTAGDNTTGIELWVSDGTQSGTKMIKDLYPGTMGSSAISPVIIGDTLYFSADDGTTAELWRLTSPDGQPEKFTDITGGGAYGDQVRRINKTFVFNAGNAAYGDELWKMTVSGTTSINENYIEGCTSLIICPNPVTESSRIKIPASIPLPAEITVFNTLGSVLSAVKVNERDVSFIDLEMILDPGMYLIKASSGRKQATAKFIILP